MAIVPATLDAARAAEALPGGLRPLPAERGRALGGILAARYDERATLRYHELIVGVIAADRGRAALWVTHIWVDDERSVAGGREVWGLPKELAEFSSEFGAVAHYVACSGDRPILRLNAARARARLAQPAIAPVWSPLRDRVRLTLGRGRMRLGLARVRVEVPVASPLASLDLRPWPLALVGYASLRMPAPR